MNHWMHRALFGTCLLALFLALPLSARGALAARSRFHSAVVTRCYTNQLRVTPDSGNSGAGHIGRYFRIHNKSSWACTLFGYPGARLVNNQGQPMHTVLHWGVGYLSGPGARRLVYLPPGGNAYFLLAWVHIPSPGQTCPGAPAIRIIPPNTYRSIPVSVLPGRIDACGGIINAGPVEPTRLP